MWRRRNEEDEAKEAKGRQNVKSWRGEVVTIKEGRQEAWEGVWGCEGVGV